MIIHSHIAASVLKPDTCEWRMSCKVQMRYYNYYIKYGIGSGTVM